MKALPAYSPHLRVVTNDDLKALPLNDKQKAKQDALVVVMRYVRKLRGEMGGASLSPAIDDFEKLFINNLIPAVVLNALAILRPTKKDKCPNRATLFRWDDKYRKHLNGDETAAAPKHRGSDRKNYGWEARAIALYNKPSKPAMAAVAEWLVDEGFKEVTASRVSRYLKTLPANLGEHGRGRLGSHFYNNTQKGFKRRDTSVFPVGFIYQGDGHCVDAYVAHPRTGDIWRPELTVWIDITSRYLVGWYISEAESSHSTLFALSHALCSWDHVPAMLHIDNGSGFRSKMMNDDSAGFYAKFDIDPMFSIPGNAKGKGQVERWFRTMEGKYGKKLDTFCGGDMADEVKQRIVRENKRGNYKLPSLQEYMTGLEAFIERYNNTVHSALDGKTPAELWATLERTPLHMSAEAVVLPKTQRTVRRGTIHLDNREYNAADLIAYNGDSVIVEYDLHDDKKVRVLTQEGRWICDAALVFKIDYLPASRVEEAATKRLKGQHKRLQNKLDEVTDRAGLAITHDMVIDDIEALNEGASMLLEDQQNDESLEVNLETGAGTPVPDSSASDELDIFSTDY